MVKSSKAMAAPAMAGPATLPAFLREPIRPMPKARCSSRTRDEARATVDGRTSA